MEIIDKYFPKLDEEQRQKLITLGPVFTSWNDKINMISRKDIDNLYVHHILHSLSIAKFISFYPGAKVLDLGTGGGFPGLPLSILFPNTYFTLIDARNKKVNVCNEIISFLNIDNATAIHGRVEEHKEKYDMVVTRAVAKVDLLLSWSNNLFSNQHKHAIPNGLIALKGNPDIEKSLLKSHDYYEIKPIAAYYEEEYFNEKFIFYVQARG